MAARSRSFTCIEAIRRVLSRTHAQSLDKAQNTMADIEPLHTIARFSDCKKNWYESVVNVKSWCRRI